MFKKGQGCKIVCAIGCIGVLSSLLSFSYHPLSLSLSCIPFQRPTQSLVFSVRQGDPAHIVERVRVFFFSFQEEVIVGLRPSWRQPIIPFFVYFLLVPHCCYIALHPF